jgi:hypothetical protein
MSGITRAAQRMVLVFEALVLSACAAGPSEAGPSAGDTSPASPGSPLEWSGPVRGDSLGMVVQPMVQFGGGGWSWPESRSRDAASPWVDITSVGTSSPSRNWSLELAAQAPRLDALATADHILAYGVVLETTGDRVADWLVGIDNDAPEGELRLWITDLATGQSEEQVGGPYGAMPFFDFSHPSEDGPSAEGSRSMRFFFLGNPGWGTSIWFYAWASLAHAGEVFAWDYAPDASWLVVGP